jgi:organic radical activating enzyme
MSAGSKVPETIFREEIFPIKIFSIGVTSRCNMDCNFCFQKDRSNYTGPDMTFSDFKKIIDGIAEHAKTADKPTICITGGEPFLNEELAKMSRYAIKVLGKSKISITTNLSRFPKTVPEAIALVKKFGNPHFNLSIDREHLRFGQDMEARINAFFTAAKKLGTSHSVQNVAQTKYQQKHRWPRNIARLIPKNIKAEVAANTNYGRTEFYSNKDSVTTLGNYLLDLKRNGNKNHPMPPFGVMMSLGVSPAYGMRLPVEVHFSTDGKAYLFSGIDALHFPQLSIGSWKRESLRDITQVNLPYKINMLNHWFGIHRTSAHEKMPQLRWIDKGAAEQKARIFGKQALKRLKAQKKQKRNFLRR